MGNMMVEVPARDYDNRATSGHVCSRGLIPPGRIFSNNHLSGGLKSCFSVEKRLTNLSAQYVLKNSIFRVVSGLAH